MGSGIEVVNISGVSPLRREATDRAEMLTQMLLGELAEVLDMTDRWLHVRLAFDAYEGWVNRNEMRFLSEDLRSSWLALPKFRNSYASVIARGTPRPIYVPLGALLGKIGTVISVPGEQIEFDFPDSGTTGLPHEIASGLLGTPYLWGGRTDVGIDCSGLVQTAHLLAGFRLPRDAWQQHALGFLRSGGLDAALPGDLVYFGSEGRITHVGFYEGGGTLLHAQGFVKRENLLVSERFYNPYPLNETLFDKLLAVQDGASVRKHALKTAD